jgi:tetratricopeptide (TPR) repeat protein
LHFVTELHASQEELESLVLRHFPFAVAWGYQRAVAPETPPLHAVDCAFYTYESLLRFSTLVFLSQFLRGDTQNPNLARAVQYLGTPSLGDWFRVLCAIPKHLFHSPHLPFDAGGPISASLVESARALPRLKVGGIPVHQNLLDQRNEKAHGAPWDQPECERRLPGLRHLLDSTLELFRPLVDLELLRRCPGGMIRLVGSKAAFTPEAMSEDGPLPELFDESELVLRGPEGALLPVYPLFLPPDGPPEGYAEVLVFAGHGQKSVVYIGTRSRTERQDTLSRYLDLLRAKNIDPRFTPDTMTPWGVAEWARATSLGAVENLKGVKYFPDFYQERRTRLAPSPTDINTPTDSEALDDEDELDGRRSLGEVDRKCADSAPEDSSPGGRGVDDIVWRWIENGKEAALLVAADAGDGKTSLFCRLTERLAGLNARAADDVGESSPSCVLLLLAGEKMRDGSNNLFRRIREGLGFSDDPAHGVHGFDQLLAAWEAGSRELDVQHEDGRLVILLDAVNEAQHPKALLEEAAELAAQASVANKKAGRPRVRILISIRTHVVEALFNHWSAQNDTPFLANSHDFAHFDGGGRRQVEYLALRPFALDEARGAFEKARACLPGACTTPWADLPPATQGLLCRPLMVLLFHHAFSGRAAPTAPTTTSALWAAWLDRTFNSGSALEGHALNLADACIDRGANQIPDDIANSLCREWQQTEMINDPVRIAASLDPLERMAAVGILRREDRGGWDWVSDALAGQIYFRALRRRTPMLSEDSLKRWLGLPATPRLSAAIVEAAATCWHSGSPLVLRALLGSRREDADHLISQTLIALAPRGAETEISREVTTFSQGLALLAVWSRASERRLECERLAHALLYDVQDALRDRRGTTAALRIVADTATELSEALVDPTEVDLPRLRDLSVAYDRIGDLEVRSAPDKARGWYQKALGVREKLVALAPDNPSFLTELAHTYRDLAVVDAPRDRPQAREWMARALRIAEELVDSNPDSPACLRTLATSQHEMARLDEWHSPANARDFYKRALEIRKILVQLEPNDFVSLLDLATSYHRLALVADSQDPTEVKRSLEKAFEITRRLVKREPENTAILQAHALSCDRIASLHKTGAPAKAKVWLKKALNIREKLVHLEPNNTALLRDLEVSYSQLGSRERRDNPAAAIAWFRKDLGIAERLRAQEPDNSTFLHDLSISCSQMAQISKASAPDQARDWLRRAVEIRERLVATVPDSSTFLYDLSISCAQMADIDEASAPDQARDWLRRAVEIRERLVATVPENTRFLRALSVSYNSLGHLEKQVDPVRARAWFGKDLRIAERLVAQEPDNSTFLYDLSISCAQMADIDKASSSDQALDWLRRAVEIRERLVATATDNTKFLTGLSHTYSTVGRLERHGAPDEARVWFNKAVLAREQLVAREPRNAAFLSRLARSYSRLGRLERRIDPEKARPWFEKALHIRKDLATTEPENLTFLSDLAFSYETMGSVDRSGDGPQASAWLENAKDIRERLVKQLPHDPKSFYNLACTYALVGWGDDAISTLSMSVELGYTDVDQAAEDLDLVSLHGRPDFQALLARMRENEEQKRKSRNTSVGPSS